MPHNSPEASLIKLIGGFGSIFATGTNVYTGSFYCIEAIENCTFSGVICDNMENVSGWLVKTLPSTASIRGNFSQIQLSSGSAMLYKH